MESAESKQRREVLAEFVELARTRGVRAVPLRAHSYDGRHRYRTPVEGWYLRRDEKVAVGTDAEYYVLGVPTSVRALLRGTTLAPQDPPLVIGAGGKDGESLDLTEALARVLRG